MKIAIISLQGAFTEHADLLKKASKELNVNCAITLAKTKKDVEGTSGIILPGGESTTINKLLKETGIDKEIIRLAKKGIPILATCAGMIIISSSGDDQCKKTGKLLGLIGMTVNRNAFGTQKHSFEKELDVKGIGKINAIFIRAPAVTEVSDPDAEILAKVDEKIVAVKKKNIMTLAFHPELTDDTKIHKWFLKSAAKSPDN
ncbi:MAG: pyridoxal 5'-phosphate synthase glutaminase subunit PdxT [Candidatus Makaraimicrobium thalassicum]|nr:MAG: pyridoxal 5'-phosphate synthase glutaminase subunit PdxT [Candidatus Omnitrophota bacterium]